MVNFSPRSSHVKLIFVAPVEDLVLAPTPPWVNLAVSLK